MSDFLLDLAACFFGLGAAITVFDDEVGLCVPQCQLCNFYDCDWTVGGFVSGRGISRLWHNLSAHEVRGCTTCEDAYGMRHR